MTVEEIQDYARREDGEMLLRLFVKDVGYDYLQHHKKNTAKIHPEFSDETRIYWEEIEKRMQKSVVIGFDKENCIALLREKASRQAEMCKTADYTSSYHYGLKEAYYDAISIIESCLSKAEK